MTPRTTLPGLLLLAPLAAAQDPLFSIDWHGPTIAAPDFAGGVPITEGDLLAPGLGTLTLGPLSRPAIAVPHGAGGLGLLPGCVGHPAGTPCPVEVDAVSRGLDALPKPVGFAAGEIRFSTDVFAASLPNGVAPNPTTELPVGDASADVWTNAAPLPPGPLPPGGPFPTVGTIDGDGMPSASAFAYPGLGLVEPNVPTPMPAHVGDTLDALDHGQPGFPASGVFFSLDPAFFDALTGLPHAGSAAAHGASGADVLHAPAPGVFGGVWAPAPALGLDLVGPDDIDALWLAENGSGVFEPSLTPYDWAGGATDALLFSVRRGSAVIGMPDSIGGVPIEEGDILTTPLPTFLGGVSPFPGIFVAAENLGLATVRSGAPGGFGDDLNALDGLDGPIVDCNGNGIEDAVDIASGVSQDANLNGIPDECEEVGKPFCFCPAPGVCGNPDPTAGCANSTGAGGLLTASGGTSVGADDLVLTVSQLPANQFNVLFMGPSVVGATPLADGLRCVGGSLWRYPAQQANASGTTVYTNLVTYANGNFPPVGQIAAGSTWYFQDWFRDVPGPCGNGSNVTHAVAVTFTP